MKLQVYPAAGQLDARMPINPAPKDLVISNTSVARLQQFAVAALAAGAMAWCIWWWPRSPVLACVGGLALALLHAFVLGIEFILLRFFGQRNRHLRPTTAALLGGWVGETIAALRVFGWRQPFRSEAHPDLLEVPREPAPRRGVVFIHGFMCNRGFWTPWIKRLAAQPRAFAAVTLQPPFGSIDGYAGQIDAAITQVTQATGMPPVLICHSMGGLAARAWLRQSAQADRVAHIITIGTPHGGTWLGRLSRFENGRQMRLGGEWVRALQDDGTPHAARFTCWYSDCDNIVFPVATATLAGAQNHLVRGVAHVALAFHPQVMAESMAKLDAL